MADTKKQFEWECFRETYGITPSPSCHSDKTAVPETDTFEQMLAHWQAVPCQCGSARCTGWRLVRKEHGEGAGA